MTVSDAPLAAPFQLMLITNSPEVAGHAISSGVDWVFVDLEIKGKQARQAGRSTVISGHTLDDVTRIRTVVPQSRLLVRINTWDGDSVREMEQVIERGADLIMLPMFRAANELASAVRVADGRCKIVGLLETAEAADRVRDIAAVDGVARIHIGLNDLHLALKRRFMFELLLDGTVSRIADALRARQVPLGIGGLARVGEGLVPAESLVAEHVALGSTAAILSRTFHRGDTDQSLLSSGPMLATEIGKLRVEVQRCRQLPQAELEAVRADTAKRIRQVVEGV